MVNEACGWPINKEPARPCLLPKAHKGAHKDRATVDKQRVLQRKIYKVTPSNGVVYFLGEWDSPFVKIGRRKMPAEKGLSGRIKELQCGNPRTLYPLHTVWSEDVARDEIVIHEMFKGFRVRSSSEWFLCDRDSTEWLQDNWFKL